MVRRVGLILLLGLAACDRADVGSGLVLSDARAPAPADSVVAAAYFTITNHGPADTLVGITTPIARRVMVHVSEQVAGVQRMRPMPDLPIGRGGSVRMAPGGTHVMLEELARRPGPGDTIVLTLTFRRAGVMRVAVPVVRYEDLAP